MFNEAETLGKYCGAAKKIALNRIIEFINCKYEYNNVIKCHYKTNNLYFEFIINLIEFETVPMTPNRTT